MAAAYPFGDPAFVVAERVESAEDGLKLLTFPGGFRCYTHSDEQEVMLMYNEIFVKREYLGSTLTLEGCSYVFDVGANIGLFTLFAKLSNPSLVVHAFEPIRATYDVLVRNIELHGLSDVHLYNQALGSADGAELAMTFYPNASGNATAHPGSKEKHRDSLVALVGKEQADHFFEGVREYTVPSRTLSAMIDATGVPAIDLLKIDTEGDELAVLQGIAEGHFPLIRQIAAEIHSPALLAETQALLTSKGFDVAADDGLSLMRTMHAVRKGRRREPPGQ